MQYFHPQKARNIKLGQLSHHKYQEIPIINWSNHYFIKYNSSTQMYSKID